MSSWSDTVYQDKIAGFKPEYDVVPGAKKADRIVVRVRTQSGDEVVQRANSRERAARKVCQQLGLD
jgi:hypothetical protein